MKIIIDWLSNEHKAQELFKAVKNVFLSSPHVKQFEAWIAIIVNIDGEENISAFLKENSSQLFQYARSEFNFELILPYLNEQQRLSLLELIKLKNTETPSILKDMGITARAFKFFFGIKNAQIYLLNILNIPKTFEKPDILVQIIKELDRATLNYFFQSNSSAFSKFIDSEYNFMLLFEAFTPYREIELLEYLSSSILEIFEKEKNWWNIFNTLSIDAKEYFLKKYHKQILDSRVSFLDIITDRDLKRGTAKILIPYMNKTHLQLFLALNDLPGHRVLGGYYDIIAVLKNLNDSNLQATFVNHFLDTINEHIENEHDLYELLDACSSISAKQIILNTVKGKLRRLLHCDTNRGNESSRREVINFTARTKKHYFFDSRSRSINVGSLASKLDKYIDNRKREYSFHWDFLGIMLFLNWLLGECWVKSKTTKIAAATYAKRCFSRADNFLVMFNKEVDLKTKRDILKSYYINTILILENGTCTKTLYYPDKTLVKFKTEVTLPTKKDILERYYSNTYILIKNGTQTPALYYVDYDGNKSRVPIKKFEGIQECFNSNRGEELTYAEAARALKPYVKQAKLPTEIQIKALQEGLLGEIMQDAGVDYILQGNKAPFPDTETHNDDLITPEETLGFA